MSGAVRRPVEPGTLPPGVIAPVPVTPPAGTFVPTGATRNVAGLAGVGTMPRTANPAVQAPWGNTAAHEDPAGTPPWQRIGVSAEEPEEDEEAETHGYTWLHLIVLSLGAFVAGVLVWLLLLQGRVDRDPDALAENPTGTLADAQVAVVVENPGEM